MERPRRGRLLGVCCTADTSSETLNRFITSNINFYKDVESFLVLIDRLDRKFTEPRERAVRTDIHSSPFEGKTPRECGDMLEKLVADTGSDINYEYLVVIDERTALDGTVLIAVISMSGRGVKTLRAAGEIANGYILAVMAGSTGFDEDAEEAASTSDGVLRYKGDGSK